MKIQYKYHSVLEILDMISDEPSRNVKIQIIKDASVNEEFVATLVAAYNPFVTYGVTKFEMGKPLPKNSTSMTLQRVYNTTLKWLADRTLTGNKAQQKLNLLTDSLNEDRAEVLVRVLKRDLRMGCSVSSINKAIPKLIPKYSVSLCSPFDKAAIEKMDYPVLAQVKEDGMRISCHASKNGKIIAKTRQGKEISLPDFIQNQLNRLASNIRMVYIYKDKDLVLDGEILVYGSDNKVLSRAKGNGIILKCIQGNASEEEMASIQIVLWDVITEDGFQKGIEEIECDSRFTTLLNSMPTLNNIRASTFRYCHDYFEIESYFTDIQLKGGEGIIVKRVNAPWKNKRTKDSVKIKDFKEGELIITDILEGAGRNTGKLGAFLCESSDGLLKTRVGTGYSDKLREEYFTNDMIGRVITVQFMSVSQDSKSETYALEHNSFKEVRMDKDEADNLETLKKA